MPRYRLRYGDSNLIVPPDGLLIGRGLDCDLQLDDGSVSRRHARVVVRGGELYVEDLGSRNGIRVNGEAVRGEQRLSPGDQISIGQHQIQAAVATSPAGTPATTLELWICQSCKSPKPGEHLPCPVCGATQELSSMPPQPTSSPTVRAPVVDFSHAARPTSHPPRPRRTRSSFPPESPRRSEPSGGFRVVTDLALKSLALGRFAEAEKMLSGYLEELLDRPEGSLVTEEGDQASLLALQLAGGLKSERWLDYVFTIYSKLRAVPPEEVVDGLYQVVGKVRYRNARLLRAYLEVINERALPASERFQRRRLEGLLNVISA